MRLTEEEKNAIIKRPRLAVEKMDEALLRLQKFGEEVMAANPSPGILRKIIFAFGRWAFSLMVRERNKIDLKLTEAERADKNE